MSGESAQSQEPTMEEILASIRKIISEDGSEGEAIPAVADNLVPEPNPVLDLTEPAPLADPLSDIMAPPEPTPPPAPSIPMAEPPPPVPEAEIAVPPPPMPPPMPEPMPEPEPALPHPPMPPMPAAGQPSGLVGADTAIQAASAFERLNNADGKNDTSTSLEMLVANLLRPALKDWLDTNLPGIVEEQVSRELARIRSMGR